MSLLNEFQKYVVKAYFEDEQSIHVIAKALGTYPNKVKRTLIALGYEMRTKSEAQSLALKHKRIKHPTEGKVRTTAEKHKIADGVANYWSSMDDEKYEERRKKSRENWYNIPDEVRRQMLEKSRESIRESARSGSKLEHHILECLVRNKINALPHQKHIIANDELELDIFLPNHNMAIEVNGPSHYLPVWGEKPLEKQMAADARKHGLLTMNKFKLIIVKQIKNLSDKRMRDVNTKILEAINQRLDFVEIEL